GGVDVDEVFGLRLAAGNLPPRTAGEPDEIAIRARENEIVKRRLAGLVDSSPTVRALVDASVRRMNGVIGQPHTFDLLDRLLNAQSYRLSHPRVAAQEIHYPPVLYVNP